MTTRASAPPTSTASGPPGLSPATAVLAADERDEVPDQHTAVRKAFAALEQAGLPAPDAVGHRVIHGGADHTAHERVDAGLGDDLRRLAAYTPLHVPAAIQGMDRLSRNSQARQSLSSVMIVTNNLIRRYRS